jgi:hypothetical protein
MEKMERQAKKKQLRKTLRSKEQEVSAEKVYLAVYNAVQFGGWFVQMCPVLLVLSLAVQPIFQSDHMGILVLFPRVPHNETSLTIFIASD